MSTENNEITTFFPKCHEESFVMVVSGAGRESTDTGIHHWFEGDGVCSECGYSGFHCDGDQ